MRIVQYINLNCAFLSAQARSRRVFLSWMLLLLSLLCAMFLCQTAILISVLWCMLPSSGSRGDRGHCSRSRSSSSKRGSSPGSLWDDEIEEETQHIELPRRKAQSLQKRQLKHQAKAADGAQASSSNKSVDTAVPREFYVTPGVRAFHAAGCGSLKVKGRHFDDRDL